MRFLVNGPEVRPDIQDYLDATGNEKEVESYRRSVYNWNPITTPDKILRITKSSLGTFGWCRRQYKYEKFDGLRGEENADHIRGKNVHDMVEWFWNNFTEEQEQQAIHLLVKGKEEDARQLFFDAVPQPPEPYIYGEEEQIHQWLEWQMRRLHHTGGDAWRPAGVEANIHATRFVEVDGEAIPIHMRGFIDSLFQDGEGYALMELKSGKYKKRGKVPSMRAEMQFYKMMLEHSPHAEFLPITHWGWEFPGGGIKDGEGPAIHYEPTTAAKRIETTVENRIKKLIKAHIEMDFPTDPWLGKPPKDMPLEELRDSGKMKCHWCSFVDHCDFWSLTDDALDKMLEELK